MRGINIQGLAETVWESAQLVFAQDQLWFVFGGLGSAGCLDPSTGAFEELRRDGFKPYAPLLCQGKAFFLDLCNSQVLDCDLCPVLRLPDFGSYMLLAEGRHGLAFDTQSHPQLLDLRPCEGGLWKSRLQEWRFLGASRELLPQLQDFCGCSCSAGGLLWLCGLNTQSESFILEMNLSTETMQAFVLPGGMRCSKWRAGVRLGDKVYFCQESGRTIIELDRITRAVRSVTVSIGEHDRLEIAVAAFGRLCLFLKPARCLLFDPATGVVHGFVHDKPWDNLSACTSPLEIYVLNGTGGRSCELLKVIETDFKPVGTPEKAAAEKSREEAREARQALEAALEAQRRAEDEAQRGRKEAQRAEEEVVRVRKRAREEVQEAREEAQRQRGWMMLWPLPDCLPRAPLLSLQQSDPRRALLQQLLSSSCAGHRAALRVHDFCPAPRLEVLDISLAFNEDLTMQYLACLKQVHRLRGGRCRALPALAHCLLKDPSRERELNEHLLFHGTPSTSLEEVLRHGFDPRRGGEMVGKMFGLGTYFAANASKADIYTEAKDRRLPRTAERKLIVARVLLGEAYRATAAMTQAARPPDGPDGRPLDSVWAEERSSGGAVDHLEAIVYKEGQALPVAVVTYKHEGDCRCAECLKRPA